MRLLRDAREVAICLLLALRVELALRGRPLPDVAAALGVRLASPERTPQRGGGAPLPQWCRRPVRVVDRVLRHWPAGPEGTCLRQSLVLGHRLRGLDPELVLGVKRGADGIDAHAWLRVAGVDLDGTAYRYQPFSAGPDT